MSIKLTDRTRALALEFVSIVLGVLLALGLSEWAEDRQHRQLADSAMANIANEIGANRDTLKLIHANNQATVEIILSGDNGDDQRSIIPGMQLQETAWSAFLATGLSAYVDYDEVLALSDVYALQRVYKQTGQQLSEAAMSATALAVATGSEIDDAHFRSQFVGYFELLTAIEAQLLDAYAGASK